MAGKVFNVVPGRIGYRDQMTRQDVLEYHRRLDWIQQQILLGKLTRGWQTQAGYVTKRPLPLISQVISGKKMSPPVLEDVYDYALKVVGEREGISLDPYDALDKAKRAVAQFKELRKQAEQVIELDRMQREAEQEIFNRKWDARDAENVAERDKYTAEIRRLEGQLIHLEIDTQLSEEGLPLQGKTLEELEKIQEAEHTDELEAARKKGVF